MKLLGVGLPRTGTASLAEACRMLGLKTLHHAPERLDVDRLVHASFRCYDDIDAVFDAPAAYFFENILPYYPGCRVLLSVRDVDRWYESIKWHIDCIHTSGNIAHIRYADRLHSLLFGSPWPERFLYQKAFRRQCQWVRAWLRSMKIEYKVINIERGDKWDVLCPFLGLPEPTEEFPWLNRKHDD